MRKITVISGTRSEYGLLKSVIWSLKKTKNLKVQLIVIGSHLEKEFGGTIREIRKDFKVDDILKLPLREDTNEAMSSLAGHSILGFVKIFKKIKPDIVLILGDRVEIFGVAVAAYYMTIPIAHLHGGDKSVGGHLDDSVRHAITKLAHIHFPATKKSAERILKMGEEKWRVFRVGAPGLDSILYSKLFSPQKIAEKYKLNLSQPVILAIQHAVTTEVEDAGKQMKETLDAIKESGYQAIVIYPNADAGGRRIINVINKYKKYPFIQVYKNLSHEDFLGLMNVASVIVGNSSSGIIEAPFFNLPAVNIGTRQLGRERAKNIIDVDYKKGDIKKAIKKALFDKKFKAKVKKCKNPYREKEMVGPKVAKILSRINIDQKLMQKKISY